MDAEAQTAPVVPLRQRTRQRFLCCRLCGALELASVGLCRRCYQRTYHSDIYFGGQRERVLARDHHQCQSCGAGTWLNVHHRRPGRHNPHWLVTLCAGCHARIHRLQVLRSWLPEATLRLWAELHPAVPQQLQFAFEAIAA